MQKGIRPGTEKRCEMLKTFLDKGMSASMIGQYTRRMCGKTEAEKEVIAKEIRKEIETGTA